jgi:hypothetical protein
MLQQVPNFSYRFEDFVALVTNILQPNESNKDLCNAKVKRMKKLHMWTSDLLFLGGLFMTCVLKTVL